MLGKDFSAILIDLHLPYGLDSCAFKTQIESADSGEQRAARHFFLGRTLRRLINSSRS
jgi:hypothetical protein